MALLGGAAFVASLACCAWTFIVTWGAPRAPRFSLTALGVDTVLFLIFAAHHSITARAPVRAWIASITGNDRVRTAYVWMASLLLVVVCLAWRPVGGIVYRQSGTLVAVHIAIQLAGLALVALSVRMIDALELAGIRSNASVLQTRGPYRLVRHPLYLGWILMVFGPAVMTADRLAFAVLTSAYLLLAVPLEERALWRVFGRSYEEYARAVRWRVIPYVY